MYEPPIKIIEEVGKHLRQSARETDIYALDALRVDLAATIREWQDLLYRKRQQMLHPKDKDLTEMDRKIMLDASISMIESDYSFLLRLEELARERIELGKTLL